MEFRFKINYLTEYGLAVFVTGSPKFLGEWDVRRAVRLNWNKVSE